MPSLVNTMLTCRQEELNVVEGSACNYSSHVEINILHNGGKGVTNCIMGSSMFVAMSTT
jgi:hypothetical protein